MTISLEEHKRQNEYHDSHTLPRFVYDKQEEVYKRHRVHLNKKELDMEILSDELGQEKFSMKYNEWISAGYKHEVVMNILKLQTTLPLDERYPVPAWVW